MALTHTYAGRGGGGHTHNRVKIAETDTGSRRSVLSGRARDPVNISFMLFIIHTRAPHNAASSRDRHNMFSTLVSRASLARTVPRRPVGRVCARPGGRGRWRALVRDTTTTTTVIYYYNVIVVMCPPHRGRKSSRRRQIVDPHTDTVPRAIVPAKRSFPGERISGVDVRYVVPDTVILKASS